MSASSIVASKSFPADEQTYRDSRALSPLRHILRKVLSVGVYAVLGFRARAKVYRAMGVNVDSDSYVGREVHLDPECPELITVEKGAHLAARVVIVCHDPLRGLVAPVRIAKDAFVGAGAIILPGVTIGEGAVVGAGAVVTKDVAPRMVAVGSPARVVGERK